jgi:hypothetical protein
MPPTVARVVDQRLALTDAERTELLLGLQASLGVRNATVTIGPGSAAPAINPLVFAALGAAIVLIAMAYPWVRRQSWQF